MITTEGHINPGRQMDHTSPCADLRETQRDVANLTEWQRNQNGALIRLDAKVDKLLYVALTAAIGALLSFTTATILLAINLAAKGP
jgi:hypothetical protein